MMHIAVGGVGLFIVAAQYGMAISRCGMWVQMLHESPEEWSLANWMPELYSGHHCSSQLDAVDTSQHKRSGRTVKACNCLTPWAAPLL
jgi:hypothetical protein